MISYILDDFLPIFIEYNNDSINMYVRLMVFCLNIVSVVVFVLLLLLFFIS